MKINGQHYRSLWWQPDKQALAIIDQTQLPHHLAIDYLQKLEDCIEAIVNMRIRGAPLIGVVAAYGMALAMRVQASDAALQQAWQQLHATRPTAINLRWALDQCAAELSVLPETERPLAALQLAQRLADEDVAVNQAIGQQGLALIQTLAAQKNNTEPVRILTHCNPGWLATVDWGTATSPIYQAQDAGIAIQVWVDETRPRNQGALTAWELASHGVDHTYIVDNAGGYLMQQGLVDLVLVGTDRVTRQGDVCNKIGTYLKALAAQANRVPFYVAMPRSSLDVRVQDGVKEIPIEERSAREVTHLSGLMADGRLAEVQVTPEGSPVANPAFDVTPHHLVTGLITERGICPATAEGLATLFPEVLSV